MSIPFDAVTYNNTIVVYRDVLCRIILLNRIPPARNEKFCQLE
jgi:hypothetical protein